MTTDANNAANNNAESNPLVLYDGVCGLCSSAVRWLIAHDPHHVLRFAPLQGTTAEQLRKRYPQLPDNLESVVLIVDGRVFLRSKVLLHVARYLNPPWRWCYWFRWLPGWPLNIGYRLVAWSRYRVWGKYDQCELPSRADASLFLP